MKAIDMRHVYGNKKYRGKWVGLKSYEERRVVAYADSLKGLLKKSERKGYPHPWVMQVPKEILPIVGGYRLVK
jgi:hypothetical protein